MRFLTTLLFCAFVLQINAQDYWQRSEIPLSTLRSDDAIYTPNQFYSLALDATVAKQELAKAVEAPFSSGKHIDFRLPMPNGELQTFHTYYAPVMEKGLADRYPSIKTYKGLSEDGKSIARFGFGPSGFHASIRTKNGEVYIDQVSKSSGQYYYSYYTADHGEPTDDIKPCGTDHDTRPPSMDEPVGPGNRNMGVEIHTYRFALACIGAWGEVRGTTERALEDMVTATNRLNQIYENEGAFRLVLISNNDRLIHLDPDTDGYNYQLQNGRVPGLEVLPQNTGRLNSLIGVGAYDIGHVFTTPCSDVGGVAYLSSACNNGNKGGGVTCQAGNVVFTAQGTMAHEIGHQFASPHVFNFCPDNAGNDTNVSFGNDFEPGSGTTIMSYAGACRLGNNIPGGSRDAYYNNGSLANIYRHSRYGGGAVDCAGKIPTDNLAPEVNIPLEDDFYIPIRTYFVLDGEATDGNDDAMTFCWEQHDAGNSNCQLGEPTGSCPLFRSRPPVEEKYRFFPAENRIISGTGDISEILPTYGRELNFAFTVRDNNPDIGIAIWDRVQFNADESAGPFRVLSPSLGDEFEQGGVMPVTWDVANTDNELVNCQGVDIYLSLNKTIHRSKEEMILLATNVPNSGSADVIVPAIDPASDVRVVVYAHNNIFFDLTDFSFKVVEASNPRPYFAMSQFRDEVCLPGVSSIDLTTSGVGGYSGNVTFEAIDLPQGVTAYFDKNDFAVGENTSVTFDISSELKTGTYGWTIRSISETDDTIERQYYVDVISTDFSDLMNIGPNEGLANSAGLPIFNWSSSFNADLYKFELASNPSFDESSTIYSVETRDTFFETPDFLDKASVFYWRVSAINACGEGAPTFVRSLGTVNLDCNEYAATDTPINISASGTREIVSKVNVLNSGEITDINIINVNLTHDLFKDLTAVLKSPTGKETTIWSSSCSNKYTMDVAFDDDSPRFFDCSNGVTIFRPIGELAIFNGDDPKGLWEFIVRDNKGGDGGKLGNVALEICGSVETATPILINNKEIFIQPNNRPRIGAKNLLTEDEDNTPEELLYTLVIEPKYGELQKFGTALTAGQTFTQEDLDQARVFYQNTVDNPSDEFYFTVEDGNGGWINITRFAIDISSNNPSSTNDPDLINEISIYPNPVTDFINVSITEKARKLNALMVMDIHGKVLTTQAVSQGLQSVNVAGLTNGVYLVKLTDGKESVIKRVIVQR